MPELDDVVTGEVVAAEWGNQIRDRTVQRYTDETERDSLSPTPSPGDLAYIDALDQIQVYHGAVWVGLLSLEGDSVIDGQLALSTPNNQLSLRESDGGADPRANLDHNSGQLRIRIGDLGDFKSMFRFTRDYALVEDSYMRIERSSVLSLLELVNTNSSHEWRFRISNLGNILLESAPLGSGNWTTVETWNPAP